MSAPNRSDRSEIRVGVLLDSFIVPAWVAAIVDDVVHRDGVALTLVTRSIAPAVFNLTTWSRSRFSAMRWDRSYLWLEQRIATIAEDALQPVDIGKTVSGAAQLEVQPDYRGVEFGFTPSALRLLRSHSLDVALLFGFGIPDQESRAVARYGVWSTREVVAMIEGGSPPGLEEVLRGEEVMSVDLHAWTSGRPDPIAIYRSYGHVDQRLAMRTRNAALWKSARIIGRRLRDLARLRPESITEFLVGDDCDRAERRMPNLSILTRAASHAMSFARDRIKLRRSFGQWSLAYRYLDAAAEYPGDLATYRELTPPPDRFWADPFPLRREGRDFIFFEEAPHDGGPGTLKVAEFGENGMLDEPRLILEKPYHLSYPCVFEFGSQLLMVPETSEVNRVDVYQCTRLPDEWSYHSTLLDGVAAADATLMEWNDRWWLFAAVAPEGVWNVEELHVFFAETPYGPWSAHSQNPVVSDVRSARPAGALFVRGDRLYRPAQDCSGGYGGGIRLMEVRELTADRYEETGVRVIDTKQLDGAIGVHTMNEHRGLAAIDIRRIRRRP